MKRQHKNLRVPDNWRGQDRTFVIQLEQILDDIYNNLNSVKSVLGIEPDSSGNIELTEEAIEGLGFIPKTAIANNLTTTQEGYVLDARQGGLLVPKTAVANNLTTTQSGYVLDARQGSLLIPKSAIANNLTTSQEGYVLDARQGKELGDKFKRISVGTTNKIKFTSGSRSTFIVLACGGSGSAGKGAYLCFAGTEGYQVETLLTSSNITVSTSSSGITFQNSSTAKNFDVIAVSGTVAYTIT